MVIAKVHLLPYLLNVLSFHMLTFRTLIKVTFCLYLPTNTYSNPTGNKHNGADHNNNSIMPGCKQHEPFNWRSLPIKAVRQHFQTLEIISVSLSLAVILSFFASHQFSEPVSVWHAIIQITHSHVPLHAIKCPGSVARFSWRNKQPGLQKSPKEGAIWVKPFKTYYTLAIWKSIRSEHIAMRCDIYI